MKNYFKKSLGIFTIMSICVFGTIQAYEHVNPMQIEVVAQTETTVAVYNGYSDTEGYKFTLQDGSTKVFQFVSEDVLGTFDLKTDDSLKEKTFEIIHTTSEEGKKETQEVITGLKEVKPGDS